MSCWLKAVEPGQGKWTAANFAKNMLVSTRTGVGPLGSYVLGLGTLDFLQTVTKPKWD